MSKLNTKVWVIKKKHVVMTAVILLVAVAVIISNLPGQTLTVISHPENPRMIHMVTGEFKTTTSDGKEIEAYLFHPGTIYVKKGEHVQLRIFGVNGSSHPFYIEGTNIKGEITKGKETVVSFTAKKQGTYRIICASHQDIAHNGPMIGYIVVD